MGVLDDFTPEEYWLLKEEYKYNKHIALSVLYVSEPTLKKWCDKHNIKADRYGMKPTMPLQERIQIIEEMEGQPLYKIAKAVKLKDARCLRAWIDTRKREGYLRDWSYKKLRGDKRVP